MSQRQTARLGICAAAVVTASSLGVLIAGGSDWNVPAANMQATVNSAADAKPVPNAEMSVSLNAQRSGALPQR